MSLKLKALGLAVFAALAVGAVSVVSASADEGGVFHSDVDWTHLSGSQEGSLHQNVKSSPIGNTTCKKVTYTANVAGKTPTEITLKPEYKECITTEDSYPTTVHVNGCAFVLTLSDIAATKHHTIHLECPTTENPTVHHEITTTINPPIVGECWIHMHAQTPTTGGVAYKNVTHNGKHALTLEITMEGVTYNTTEVGFAGCGGGGNKEGNDSSLRAIATLTGFDTGGNQVNITATTASS